MRRASPVGAPAASSNLHLVGRYVGETWLILHQAAYFTYNKGDAFSEVDTAYQIAFGSESDRRTAYVHSIFHAQLDKSVFVKKLVLDAVESLGYVTAVLSVRANLSCGQWWGY